MGVFDHILGGLVAWWLGGLAACGSEPDIVVKDATHLKARRTACSLAKKELIRAVLAERSPG